MLKKITLKNFRNHKKIDLELGDVTVLVGQNGAGKSNILEAISILSFCRSFREDDKKALINFDADFANIKGDDLEIFLQKNPRFYFQAKKNGVVKKQADFIGSLRSVVFSPETISIITGSPKNRRKFLDILISQLNRDYLIALVQYEKIRTERNSLLSRIKQGLASEKELDFWNKQLITQGEIIVGYRRQAIDFLNSKITQFYSQISGRKDKLEIDYLVSSKDDFATELTRSRQRDIASGHTQIGPHRDDLIFNLNLTNMASYASRGEIRSAIMALKFAEIEYLLNDDKGNDVILLLDDVFSEFDEKRRNQLCDLIAKYQTVITATETAHMSEDLLGNALIIEL